MEGSTIKTTIIFRSFGDFRETIQDERKAYLYSNVRNTLKQYLSHLLPKIQNSTHFGDCVHACHYRGGQTLKDPLSLLAKSITFHRCYGLLELNYRGFECEGSGGRQESKEMCRVWRNGGS